MARSQTQAFLANELVRLEIEQGQVAIVTLNRPQVMNAVNAELAQALERIVALVEDDASIRVGIITGQGDKAFCAGADLKEVAAGRLNTTFTPTGGFAGFVHAPRRKPWIAAVNGIALAGGFEIVLACDLAVAREGAQFGLPEVKRGLIASAGGLYRLPRTVPRTIALELIATGGTLDARRAHELGLLNRVVSGADLLTTVRDLAWAICANAPLAVEESLAIAKAAANFDDHGLRFAGDEAQMKLASTADFREGALAFVEKRAPVWKGR